VSRKAAIYHRAEASGHIDDRAWSGGNVGRVAVRSLRAGKPLISSSGTSSCRAVSMGSISRGTYAVVFC
jgi:hypothetical protein